MAKKRRVGSIRWDGDKCVIRVQRMGRQVCRTFHGLTQEQAEGRALAMARDLGALDLSGEPMTLREYYEGVFRESDSNRGTPRTGSTLQWYDNAMTRHVMPALGDVPLRQITHSMVRACVQRSSAPATCKRALRAVLRAAYDDELVDERPFDRRVPTHAPKRPQARPWSRFEAARALACADPADAPDVAAYLVLGLSGLRKEEALGATPAQVAEGSTYSVETGERVETMTCTVTQVYTDEDGLRPGAKNDFSVRTVPVLEAGRGLLRAVLDASRAEALAHVPDGDERARRDALAAWAAARLIPWTGWGFSSRWRRWCESHGLRPIPPKMLRHTSDTLMLTAGVSPDLSDRMHGRTQHATTYQHYFRPDVADMEEASRRVSDVLRPGA